MGGKLAIVDADLIFGISFQKSVEPELRKFLAKNKILRKKEKEGREWARVEKDVQEGKLSHLRAQRKVFRKIGAPRLGKAWMEIDDRILVQKMRVLPNARVLLKNLRAGGFEVALIYDAVHDRKILEKMFRKLGLRSYVRSVFWSNLIGFRKSQSGAYEKILNNLKRGPDDAIFVGRDPEAIRAAKAVGIKTLRIV